MAFGSDWRREENFGKFEKYRGKSNKYMEKIIFRIIRWIDAENNDNLENIEVIRQAGETGHEKIRKHESCVLGFGLPL